MLSNQATPSLVHHYKQFPLNDEPFNKKVQKHIPQRIDVVGKSAEFTIKTGLLELLPDECMVGVECCYMRDATPLASETYELGRIRSEYDWKPLSVDGYRIRPVVNVTTVNDVIEVRNFPGTDTGYGTNGVNIIVQTKEFMPVSNLAAPFDVVTYTWQFMGWGFQSARAAILIGGLTNLDLPSNLGGLGTMNSQFPRFAIEGEGIDLPNIRMIVISLVNNPDSSQTLIIFKENTYAPYVGQLVQVGIPGATESGIIFTVYEVIDSNTFKVIMSPADVGFYGLNTTDLNIETTGSFFKNDMILNGLGYVPSIEMIPGTIFKIYQLPDGTCSWEFGDQTFASPVLGPPDRAFMYINYPGCEADFKMYFQPTMVIPPILSASTASSITNINIDSPLFTSARTYSTATNSYSQTIGSFPVNSNNTVAFKEAVNNRNCSMYQINKNILNNFEIPFRITVDDGNELYQVQDPTKFYIRFSLWFYEQTDDERYYYIPTM
jgi:hypothetical protein